MAPTATTQDPRFLTAIERTTAAIQAFGAVISYAKTGGYYVVYDRDFILGTVQRGIDGRWRSRDRNHDLVATSRSRHGAAKALTRRGIMEPKRTRR